MKKDKNTHIEEKIKKSLETVRPSLQADGGDVEFESFDEKTGTVKVNLTGHCAHCPMSQLTLKEGVEAILKKEVPEVKKVINE
ncbi:MAG TPA: NifU family protein [Candidatus Methylomirabilis sp.]|nr:NifU family protein [Candidatus Methylomirabilis sp.]